MSSALMMPPWTPTGRELYRFSPDQYRQLLDAGVVTGADEADVLAGVHRFSVQQFHRMVKGGFFTGGERIELLEGLLVIKMGINPPHSASLQRSWKRIYALLPAGWTIRIQDAITLTTTEPLPDIAIVRGGDSDYDARHPGPADLGLVVEVADTSLAYDRVRKALLYAIAGVVEYWVINLNDRQVEVMTRPMPAGYGHGATYGPGELVPLTLDGKVVGTIAVNDLLP